MKKIILFTALCIFNQILQAQTGSILSTGNWYKIAVNESGIFKITYSDLENLGIDMNSINSQNIRIYGNGAGVLPTANYQYRPNDLIENAIKVIGENDNIFNTEDYILFYGQSPVLWKIKDDTSGFKHQMNIYSDYTYYFLNFDIGPGKRIQTRQSTGSTPTHNVSSFDDYIMHESDLYNFIKSGKDWFGEKFDTILTYNFSYYFPNIDQSYPLKLFTKAAARSDTSSSFSFDINLQNVLNVNLNPVNLTSYSNYASTNTGTVEINSLSDTISLSITYNKSHPISIGWLDYFELCVRRNLIMNSSQMLFRDRLSFGTGNISKYTIADSPANVEFWDVADPLNAVQQLPQEPVSNSEFIFVTTSDSLREFIAFDYTSFLTPQFIGAIPNQNLHGYESANLLIVTDELFLNEASQLASHHNVSDNLSVNVATTKQIYNEFSSGAQDISAIRDFAKMLYLKGQGSPDSLMYLLLMGDASYDYKNRIDNNTNFVPTFESSESMNPTQSFSSDDFYVLFDSLEGNMNNNELLDIGYGRLPVRTQSDAQNVINKIINYSTNPLTNNNWKTDVCFIADDQDANQHVIQADSLAKKIDSYNQCYNIKKIYFDDYIEIQDSSGQSYPAVNVDINSSVQNGALIINYTGHGGDYGWAHEHVLDTSTIQNWNNINNLPFFFTASVNFGKYDDPAVISGGERIILKPNGGGIGGIFPSRLVYSSPNFFMNLSFYDYIFSLNPDSNHYSVGDIIKFIKNSQSGSNKRNFNLLADPALKLSYPDYKVVTTQINGTNVQNSLDTIYPGDPINITGHIEDNQGLVINSFNGNLHYRLYNPDNIDTTIGNNGESQFIFHRQDRIVIEGNTVITNGVFEVQLISPVNISAGYGYPKFSFYASTSTNDAIGCFDDLVIYGDSLLQNSLILYVNTIATTCELSNGSAFVTIDGGIPPYHYQWSNGDTTSTTDSLSAGIFMVTVTDATGVSNFAIATISSANGPQITASAITNVLCNSGQNGAINITVNGGTQPYSFEWSNGLTTEDITNLAAGPYELEVTDAAGCKSVQSFTITEPEPLSVAVTTNDATCNNSDGSASLSVTGGTPPYNYLWNDPSATATATATNLPAGTYSCAISDSHSCLAVMSAHIAVSNAGGPVIAADSILNATCGGSSGAVYIHITGGAPPYSYLWSNGSTTEDITGVASDIYDITVTDALSCKGVESFAITQITPIEQPICLVTVDSATNRNKIMWEKVQTNGVSYYNIYKESTQANHYYLVATLPSDSMSIYIDPISNPNVRSWRYKISAVDMCGNESQLSPSHKTIHLTVNDGIGNAWNLIWDNYEGFVFYSYIIYRHTQATGWELIDTIPNNIFTYTDNPSSFGHLDYKLVVVSPDSCYPSSPDKTQMGPYSQSVSNIDDNGIAENIYENINADKSINIYPNPARNEIIIEILQTERRYGMACEIIDAEGRLIKKSKLSDQINRIDLKELNSGFYIIKVKSEDGIIVKKIIKQ